MPQREASTQVCALRHPTPQTRHPTYLLDQCRKNRVPQQLCRDGWHVRIADRKPGVEQRYNSGHGEELVKLKKERGVLLTFGTVHSNATTVV